MPDPTPGSAARPAKPLRCRKACQGITHDPHHWVGKVPDVLFFCDGDRDAN